MSEEESSLADRIAQSDAETRQHINEVRKRLYQIIELLDERAQVHDKSKLESPEREIFGAHCAELHKTEYGTPEYSALLEKVKGAIDHHHSRNRHHSEFWENGINDMDLIDICEMVADWVSSCLRMKCGNIHKSLKVNRERYGISDQLYGIIENTIDRYFT